MKKEKNKSDAPVYTETFRRKFSDHISKNGLKIKFVAEKVNVTSSTISNYLTGRTVPDIVALCNICEIMDVTPNDLLGISKKTMATKKAELAKMNTGECQLCGSTENILTLSSKIEGYSQLCEKCLDDIIKSKTL